MRADSWTQVPTVRSVVKPKRMAVAVFVLLLLLLLLPSAHRRTH